MLKKTRLAGGRPPGVPWLCPSHLQGRSPLHPPVAALVKLFNRGRKLGVCPEPSAKEYSYFLTAAVGARTWAKKGLCHGTTPQPPFSPLPPPVFLRPCNQVRLKICLPLPPRLCLWINGARQSLHLTHSFSICKPAFCVNKVDY